MDTNKKISLCHSAHSLYEYNEIGVRFCTCHKICCLVDVYSYSISSICLHRLAIGQADRSLQGKFAKLYVQLSSFFCITTHYQLRSPNMNPIPNPDASGMLSVNIFFTFFRYFCISLSVISPSLSF